MSEKPDHGSRRTQTFAQQVGKKADSKIKARRNSSHVWFGLGMMGLIGWSIVVPTLLGAWLGHWLDAQHAGPRSWTLALLVAGLVLGCVNAWHWVSKEDKSISDEQKDRHE